jgi:hypothetical protein
LGTGRCGSCPQNYSPSAKEQLSCVRCEQGKYQDRESQAYCEATVPCGPGQFDSSGGKNRSAGRCKACASGFFSLYDASLCTRCPPDKFQNEPGKSYCGEPKANALVRPVTMDPDTGAVLRAELWTCVTGMQCSGGSNRSYDGGVWHDPRVKFPTQRQMYTCVTDGCPDEGDTVMECKVGYQPLSPLCAVCSDGYVLKRRQCVECKTTVSSI